MAIIKHPYYPIIYLRGYAMTRGAIEDTVATPYMGFNLGSTRMRQEWDRSISQHIFESPLVRLMKDYGYVDNYQYGRQQEGKIPARSVIIYRYYDAADPILGSGSTLSIEAAAEGLSRLILQIRQQVCGDDSNAQAAFKVYLVAHSMGGLICRSLLQNDAIGSVAAKTAVDKVFTYGTPHNGIDLRGFNVPRWFGAMDANNFNRKRMASYLDLPDSDRVDSLNERFDPQRFFCLVGTNHQDYSLVRYPVGPSSDGLVKIENATLRGAPRAYVYRSHSGDLGLVNSEEGYQNLVRFLFGDAFVTATLRVDELPLPPRVQAEYDKGHEVRASYLFESTVTARGLFDVNLTERRQDEASAIFRSFDELFQPQRVLRDSARSPVLCSVFLDSSKISAGQTMEFTLILAVRSTDYLVRRGLRQERIPAESLYTGSITLKASKHGAGWRLRYVLSDEEWSAG
ncbi:MAG: hypothetical protein RQ757_10160, partial [Pseudomonadales bacterium]|nr:hypothetical protein [Pseudomonadales bacterium]